MRAAPARPGRLRGDATGVRETPPPLRRQPPGGYRKRDAEDYDRTLCLLPRDVVDFVLATQPKEWKKLEQHHGAAVQEQFLKRLAAEIERRGALDVLRNGIKDSGCKFQLAYFRPASGLNEETRRLHAATSSPSCASSATATKNENSLDLVLFLNGIPIFTAELKNPLNGQDVEDAIRQYKTDRDPREPLFAYGRCLAHFAVDPGPRLRDDAARRAEDALPALQPGQVRRRRQSAGAAHRKGYATAYLWEETWARDSVLDLVRQFIHEVEEEDEKGRKTGKRFLIFPRYQQLDCVRRLVADARAMRRGPALPDPALGRQRQELHHRLAGPPALDAPRRRRPARLRLDRRHHRPARARPAAPDAPCASSSRRSAWSRTSTRPRASSRRRSKSGKTIIVTTLQKFPVIAKEIGELPGKRFAVIVDEAHSSQSGESTKSLKAVLARRVARRGRDEEAERRRRGGARRHDPRRDGEARAAA